MRISNCYYDQKRCYNCGSFEDGVVFGKNQRLLCLPCINKLSIIQNHICHECNMLKDCFVCGKDNEDVKENLIFICKDCIENAKLLLKEY